MHTKIAGKLRDVPDEPGCYLMRDRRGRIIYVGKAASLRKRVRSYFRKSSISGSDPKQRSLVNSAHDIEFIVVRNEAEAILTEGRLIKEYKPYFNVKLRDDKRFLMIRAEAGLRFPRFALCRIQRDDGAAYFGPYASSAAARTTLDFAEKKFGIRKCAPLLPDEQTYKHCINDIVRYCSAPCVGRIGQEEYAARFEEACAFLRCERPQYIREVRAEMEAASTAMDFERAAALRDTLMRLLSAVKRKARMAQTPEMRLNEGRAGVEELGKTLGLERSPHTIEGYDISNISGTFAVGSKVCSVDGIPLKRQYRRFEIRTAQRNNDAAMMAEVIRRRFGSGGAEPAHRHGCGVHVGPDLLLVDGGMAQVHAARAEIERLGLAIPVAGLAKRIEEVYWRDGEAPIRLPDGSPALKVLQRLRDEAHRFAHSYHLKLRKRKIRESLLDDVEGIGERRKQSLLEHFGSVERLRKATEAQIAGIPGIGPKLARDIKGTVATLRRRRRIR